MDLVHECCCGLDVHQDSVVACLRRQTGKHAQTEIRTFGTMTGHLRALRDWLVAAGAEAVAMELTGVYWKPVYNLLEEVLPVLLVNPRHFKQVPGRKTDVKDCEWLADLLAHGLLKASFIPPREQRELRELTRQRAQWVAEQARTANRIQKVLEDANTKLASVASDALGVSGRAMLDALCRGEDDPEALAELARGRLRHRLPELREALDGVVTGHHRYLLGQLLDHLLELARMVQNVSDRIAEYTRPFAAAAARLMTIPGIQQRTAEVLLAELGGHLNSFPSAQHLASWAGMCPGNLQTGGRRREAKTTKGSRWLRAALTQAAWAASRTKDAYLAAQYQHLARRRGKQEALVAVGHTILTIVYHVLTEGSEYRDLGADWFDRQDQARVKRQLTARLEALGYRVTIEAA